MSAFLDTHSEAWRDHPAVEACMSAFLDIADATITNETHHIEVSSMIYSEKLNPKSKRKDGSIDYTLSLRQRVPPDESGSDDESLQGDSTLSLVYLPGGLKDLGAISAKALPEGARDLDDLCQSFIEQKSTKPLIMRMWGIPLDLAIGETIAVHPTSSSHRTHSSTHTDQEVRMKSLCELFGLAASHAKISDTHSIELSEIGGMNGRLGFSCAARLRATDHPSQSEVPSLRAGLSYIQSNHSIFNMLIPQQDSFLRVDKLGPLLLAELNRQFPDSARASTDRPIRFTLRVPAPERLDALSTVLPVTNKNTDSKITEAPDSPIEANHDEEGIEGSRMSDDTAHPLQLVMGNTEHDPIEISSSSEESDEDMDAEGETDDEEMYEGRDASIATTWINANTTTTTDPGVPAPSTSPTELLARQDGTLSMEQFLKITTPSNFSGNFE